MKLKYQCFIYETEISGSHPPVDIYESEDLLHIDIDLPGIEPEKVLIKIIDDLLIIEGIKSKKYEEDRKYLCMERRKEAFRRIIKLPIEIDARNGRAIYQNGVVLLRLPKIKSEVVKIKINREHEQGLS